MWILESSSELFQGRRMWLKPGKSYLFGRVKKDGVRFAIEHKTISRKHFIITVDEVKLEDVGNIHARTKITIEDQKSKAGTTVNGENIKDKSRELKNEENYIKPGSLPEDLVIRWHSYVLTYNLLKKELKTGVLKQKQERVKELDIKAVSEYVTGKTTHLVVNKRNTPKSLQSLIDGTPLVAESFIDALEYAATPSDLNEEENLSPLEQDFDNAWPEAHDYLPPPGRELTSRSAEAYNPDSMRKNVFENFTFVFLDQNQYDNLLPPITNGHGKALLCQIVVGETETDQLVTFLRNVAGQKGFGDAQKDLDTGGVVLVRYKGDTGAEEWTNTLINEVSLQVDQRAIDQGEFLDAILANDAMLLRQAVPFESNHVSLTAPKATANPIAPLSQARRSELPDPVPETSHRTTSQRASVSPPVTPSHSSIAIDNGLSRRSSEFSQEQAVTREHSVHNNKLEPPITRTRFMLPKKSRVLGFDDDFDPDKVIPYQDDEDGNDNMIQDSPLHHGSSPLQVGSEPEASRKETASSRKRPRSPTGGSHATLDDDMDDLLPAAAAMKRRKLAKEDQNGILLKSTSTKPIPALSKMPKPQKDIDVRKVAKAQRLAEDEKIKKEQDDWDEDLRHEPGQSLPVYEIETVLIELPTRHRISHEKSQAATDRWDPLWNGRKNFKGFRRAKDHTNGGEEADTRRRNHNKVIVPLVDAKTSTYGMGDQYWDKTEQEKERNRDRKKRLSQRTTQSQSEHGVLSNSYQSKTIIDSDEEDDQVSKNQNGVRTSPEVSKLQHEAEEIMNHAVDVDEPRRTRASDTQSSLAYSARGGKRPANGIGRGEAAKKQKTLPVTVVHGSDSDDSDDMKFKFGSRRRGRGKT